MKKTVALFLLLLPLLAPFQGAALAADPFSCNDIAYTCEAVFVESEQVRQLVEDHDRWDDLLFNDIIQVTMQTWRFSTLAFRNGANAKIYSGIFAIRAPPLHPLP